MTTQQTKQTEPRSIYVPVYIMTDTGREWFDVTHFSTYDEANAFGLTAEKLLDSKLLASKLLDSKFSRVARFEEVPS